MRRVLTGIEIVALIAAVPTIAFISAPPTDAVLGGRGIVLIAASIVALVVETMRRMP